MKLNEIVLEDSEQLQEIKLKHALAGAALAATVAAGGMHKHDTEQTKAKVVAAQSAESEAKLAAKAAKTEAEREKLEILKLTDIILDKYKISPAKAEEIAKLAKKHESESFPKAEDLLAIIGIESSFNPRATSSRLKHDKAIGLTQVRPKIWGVNASELKASLDKQVSLGAKILNKYYHKLGSEDKAVHAYNIGLTNFRYNKKLNPEYVAKWKNELKRYDEI